MLFTNLVRTFIWFLNEVQIYFSALRFYKDEIIKRL